MCCSLKSNVQANGLYKRPQLLHLQLDTGGVVMTSAQVAEQIKSIFPLFYIQGRSSRVIIDLRCSSFFIMQTDMLYTKKRKKVSEKDAFFFLLCRSSIIHFYFKTIFVFLNYLFPRSYPTEISKKEKSTDFFSQFP